MIVRFLDLARTEQGEAEAMLAAVQSVIASGMYVEGPELERFEQKIAKRLNSTYAVGVASGTAALSLALRALNIGSGDEVITSAMTSVATANAISSTGARPVFADITDDLTLDPGDVSQHIGRHTQAIMPVHYAGRSAPISELKTIASNNGLRLIEDASQAFGAQSGNQYLGTFGEFGCISLNPMKVLGAAGEAGVVLCQDEQSVNLLKSLRYHGLDKHKRCVHKAENIRLDSLQAAILSVKLDFIDQKITKRRAIAAQYREALKGLVSCPEEDPGHVYYTFTIRCSRRDALLAFLQERGIETKVYHPVLNQEPAYAKAKGHFKNAEKIYDEKLSIPCYPGLRSDEIEFVIQSIKEFYR